MHLDLGGPVNEAIRAQVGSMAESKVPCGAALCICLGLTQAPGCPTPYPSQPLQSAAPSPPFYLPAPPSPLHPPTPMPPLQMSETLGANTMRAASSASPSRSSPHIHAWIETASLGNAVSGHTHVAHQAAKRSEAEAQRPHRARSRSNSPGPGMHSPCSEAGGSVYR